MNVISKYNSDCSLETVAFLERTTVPLAKVDDSFANVKAVSLRLGEVTNQHHRYSR